MKEISPRKIINYKKVKVVILSGLETVRERESEKVRERKIERKKGEREWKNWEEF